jgi:hypothetical protein
VELVNVKVPRSAPGKLKPRAVIVPLVEVLQIVKLNELPVKVKFEIVAVATGVVAVTVLVVIASAWAITLKANIIKVAALVNSILRIIFIYPPERLPEVTEKVSRKPEKTASTK